MTAPQETRLHRWTRWGPAAVRRLDTGVEAVVGDQTVELDVTNRGLIYEQTSRPLRLGFYACLEIGVLVRWNGEDVATIRHTEPRRLGLARRSRYAVVGDDRFVVPGMQLTERAIPPLLTLRADSGVLVSSRRWAEPLNIAVTEWSFVREDDVVPPRVRGGTRPEHVALWMAVRHA